MARPWWYPSALRRNHAAEKPEERARAVIDRLLAAASWSVQSINEANIHAARGVAIREFPLVAGHGFADYLLYIDAKAAGTIEAKKEGVTLTGVEVQSDRYAQGLPEALPAWNRPLPFSYQSTGVETRFTNGLDPEPRSRPTFAFHRPVSLRKWLDLLSTPTALATGSGAAAPVAALAPPTFLALVRHLPPLIEIGLWSAQVRAIRNLEASLAADKPRALIQMATGSGNETSAQLLQRILELRRIQWRGKRKYKEPAKAEIKAVPDMPPGWTSVSWETILESEEGAFKRGPFGSALKKSIFVAKGFKVYEQYCPINDDCSFGRYYITPEKFEELRFFQVRAGDYLISCTGVTLGRITRVPAQFDAGIINQALLRVRLNSAVVDHDYFLHLFRSPHFQRLIFDQSTGSAIPNVKVVAELKSIPIPLPPIAEQQRISAEVDRRFSFVRWVEADVDANLKRAERLRQSTLSAAFTKDALQ